MAKTRNTRNTTEEVKPITTETINEGLNKLLSEQDPKRLGSLGDEVINPGSESSDSDHETVNTNTSITPEPESETNTQEATDSSASAESNESENSQTQTTIQDDTSVTTDSSASAESNESENSQTQTMMKLETSVKSIFDRLHLMSKTSVHKRPSNATIMKKITAIKEYCDEMTTDMSDDDIIASYGGDINRMFGLYEAVVFGKGNPETVISDIKTECDNRGLSYKNTMRVFSLISERDICKMYLVLKGASIPKMPATSIASIAACTSISAEYSNSESRTITKTPTHTSGANINITYGNVNVTVSNPVATTNTGYVAPSKSDDTISISGIKNLEKLRIPKSAIENLKTSDKEAFKNFRLRFED